MISLVIMAFPSIQLFPETKQTRELSCVKAKLSNFICPRDNFLIPVPVLVAKRKSGNPPIQRSILKLTNTTKG